jgi:crossover junction endodeoxyribonuclease RuvC
MEFIQLNELQLNKMDDHYMKLKRIFERLVNWLIIMRLMKLQLKLRFWEKNVIC